MEEICTNYGSVKFRGFLTSAAPVAVAAGVAAEAVAKAAAATVAATAAVSAAAPCSVDSIWRGTQCWKDAIVSRLIGSLRCKWTLIF